MKAPHLPPSSRQVWRWFCQMNDRREYHRITEPVTIPPQGRLGWQVKTRALPLAPERVDSWMSQRRIAPEQWQLAALDLIDDVYIKIKNDPPAPAQAATGKDVIAMFRGLVAEAKKGKKAKRK